MSELLTMNNLTCQSLVSITILEIKSFLTKQLKMVIFVQ